MQNPDRHLAYGGLYWCAKLSRRMTYAGADARSTIGADVDKRRRLDNSRQISWPRGFIPSTRTLDTNQILCKRLILNLQANSVG